MPHFCTELENKQKSNKKKQGSNDSKFANPQKNSFLNLSAPLIPM